MYGVGRPSLLASDCMLFLLALYSVAAEKDEDALNPEDIERALLNMPPFNSVLNGRYL